MAVENTKEWLRKYVNDPLQLCNKLTRYFPAISKQQLLSYLQQFGMYRNSKKAEVDFEQLQEEQVWNQVERLFSKYQKQWEGPDIPVFILPHKGQTLFRNGHNKSGLAFNDKLFLFVSPKLSTNHLEALFIHEYHHVCRFNKQNKNLEEYTLAESIILEGLAEYTVEQLLDRRYVAPWIKRYSHSFLKQFWKETFKENLGLTRKEKRHEVLLYGKGGYPSMIGYSMGFFLVEQYMQKHAFDISSSFELSAEAVCDYEHDGEK
ncbi:MAG: DUF2268 domain-containing protein [Bacillus sp. (in: firmicutes)]